MQIFLLLYFNYWRWCWQYLLTACIDKTVRSNIIYFSWRTRVQSNQCDHCEGLKSIKTKTPAIQIDIYHCSIRSSEWSKPSNWLHIYIFCLIKLMQPAPRPLLTTLKRTQHYWNISIDNFFDSILNCCLWIQVFCPIQILLCFNSEHHDSIIIKTEPGTSNPAGPVINWRILK